MTDYKTAFLLLSGIIPPFYTPKTGIIPCFYALKSGIIPSFSVLKSGIIPKWWGLIGGLHRSRSVVWRSVCP